MDQYLKILIGLVLNTVFAYYSVLKLPIVYIRKVVEIDECIVSTHPRVISERDDPATSPHSSQISVVFCQYGPGQHME